jgi:hypothetical protein
VASNSQPYARFGISVALSGSTWVVSSFRESTNVTGVNGNQNDTSAANAGAAYTFMQSGTTWAQQAYLKASNTRPEAQFGGSAAFTASGSPVVGSYGESSGSATDQSDTSAIGAGAAYTF